MKAKAKVLAEAVPPRETVTAGVPTLASTVADAPVMVAFVPAGPVAPCGPVSPLAPCAPVAPVAPLEGFPVSVAPRYQLPFEPIVGVVPAGPVAPVAPFAPAGPVAPCGPISPLGP